jgi:hypothetical protein
MKKKILKITLVITALFFGVNTNAQCPTISDTTNYTGTTDSWTVPSGVTSIHFAVYGAAGGEGSATTNSIGGLGGSVEGDLPVTAGQVLNIFVGELGQNTSGNDSGVVGSFNGGGAGGSSIGGTSQPGGAAGGGASDIRIGGITLNDRVVVAGGGGGSGGGTGTSGPVHGGAGGGLTGGLSTSYASGVGFEALGGTQIAGGDSGTYNYASMCGGTAGSLGLGGDGWGCGYSGGGGGGGGYYGGGGGSTHFESGGGGGSSYTDPTATNVVHVQGTRAGNGMVIITYTASVDTSTSLLGQTITSNESGAGATYQWLDCDNSFNVLTGETGVSYTATANGNYAVEITVSGCTDTSACVSITGVGINELTNESVSIYPNPTNNFVTISLGNHSGAVNYTLTTVEGKIVVKQNNIKGNKIIINLSSESKGIYFLKIEGVAFTKVYKIVKE